MWMDLENIILREVSHTKKIQILYDITYIWDLKIKTNKSVCKTETKPQLSETNLWLSEGRGKGGETN